MANWSGFPREIFPASGGGGHRAKLPNPAVDKWATDMGQQHIKLCGTTGAQFASLKSLFDEDTNFKVVPRDRNGFLKNKINLI